jgi:hypothetical protein
MADILNAKDLTDVWSELVNQKFVEPKLFGKRPAVPETPKIAFVGVIMVEDGKEVERRVREPVPVEAQDLLEITVKDGLYVKLAREPGLAFGDKPKFMKQMDNNGNTIKQPRAERRREEKEMQRTLRLITLE